MTKLVNYTEDQIQRGYILRCKWDYPYEGVVDLLVCDSFLPERSGCRLVVASGYKAGLTNCVLPEESLPEGFASGLKTDWLFNNFTEWFPIPIADVWVVPDCVPEMPCD